MLTSRADHMAPHQLASAGDGQKKSRHSVTDDGTMWGRAGHFRGSPLTLCASFWSVWPHRAAVVRWSGFLRRIAWVLGCWLLVLGSEFAQRQIWSGIELDGLLRGPNRASGKTHPFASQRAVVCLVPCSIWYGYGTMSWEKKSKATI